MDEISDENLLSTLIGKRVFVCIRICQNSYEQIFIRKRIQYKLQTYPKALQWYHLL